MQETDNKNNVYRREHWSGQSRDGLLVNGDGFHVFRMAEDGQILEAYEYYEALDGTEVASFLPEFD